MASVVYLSYPLSETTPLYGNGTGIELHPDKQMRSGDSCNTMVWKFPNHAGTHVDAPKHFSSLGKSIADYDATFWIFNRVEIADISEKVVDCQLIEPESLPAFTSEEPELLLIKTGYGKYRGTDRYTLTPPGISENVAHWLRRHYPSVRCVGMDLISVSGFSNRKAGRDAHNAFLAPKTGNPILLIEDMNLKFDGILKQIIISPVVVELADGTPCTIFGVLK